MSFDIQKLVNNLDIYTFVLDSIFKKFLTQAKDDDVDGSVVTLKRCEQKPAVSKQGLSPRRILW